MVTTAMSLVDFFCESKTTYSNTFREEDVQKWVRLTTLSKILGIPHCGCKSIEVTKLTKDKKIFIKLLGKGESELCTLRLRPNHFSLPKLRVKGATPEEAYAWFSQQKIDPKKYVAEVLDYAGSEGWSMNFVINKRGAFGEIIHGGRDQMAWGNKNGIQPDHFCFDFKRFWIAGGDKKEEEILKDVIGRLRVEDEKLKNTLKETLKSWFFKDYLCGYFEATMTDRYGLWFIDYNRVLGRIYKDYFLERTDGTPLSGKLARVRGRAGCLGKVKGRVKIVLFEDVSRVSLEEDEILVCEMTTPEYVALISQARGIITDKGGTLSHAAVIARELRKPCLVGTQNATSVLKNGQEITLDADKGIVIVKGDV